MSELRTHYNQDQLIMALTNTLGTALSVAGLLLLAMKVVGSYALVK